jgi:uncharacterized membrane protein YfcA
VPESLAAHLAAVFSREPEVWLIVAATAIFVFGGLVKGLLGVGLPLVTIPLLALIMPAPKAIALLCAPIVASNLWQAVEGGHARAALGRFSPLIVPMMLTTVLTVWLTLGMKPGTLNALIACTVLLAVALIAWQPRLSVDCRRERQWSVGVGLMSGALGGVSAAMGPLLITYLVALRLPREAFVGSISVLNLLGSLPLYLSLGWLGQLGWAEAGLSLGALVPMFAGMSLGKRLRTRVSETAFRRMLLSFLVIIALLLLLR